VRVQKKQPVLAPRLPPHSHHCQLSACHFPARSRFLRTVCSVAGPDFELVVFAAVGRTKEVGHLAVHAGTVAAAAAVEFHSDTTVPDLVYLSRLTDSMLPAPPHLV